MKNPSTAAGFCFAQSVLMMLTAATMLVRMSSGSTSRTAMLLLLELMRHRRVDIGRVDHLVGERHRQLRHRQHLDVGVLQRQPHRLQQLVHLVGDDRSRTRDADRAALEILEALDLVLQVGPDHHEMAERRRSAIARDDDRILRRDRVEEVRLHAAFQHLHPVGADMRHRVGRRRHALELEVDAGSGEIALLLGDHDRARHHRRHPADLDLLGRRERPRRQPDKSGSGQGDRRRASHARIAHRTHPP